MRIVSACIGILACLVLAAGASASTITYAVSGIGDFGTVNLNTGLLTVIGVDTVPNNSGIDIGPSGNVYEYTYTNSLELINPVNGTTTLVGNGTMPSVFVSGGLTTGFYYALDRSNNLYSINLSTGATTFIGATGIPAIGAGCGFDNSLSGSATTLYFTIEYFSCNSSAGNLVDTLYTINPTNGSSMFVATISGASGIVGSGYVAGTLYGFSNNMYSLNTSNGSASFIGTPGEQVFGAASTATGIAATPEPGSLVLLASGLLGLGGAIRRRIASR